jgi:hypothetical protein
MLNESGASDKPASGVVFQHHLQVDRERDHQAAKGDLLQRLRRDAKAEVLRLEKAGVDQCRLALALAPDEPTGE